MRCNNLMEYHAAINFFCEDYSIMGNCLREHKEKDSEDKILHNIPCNNYCNHKHMNRYNQRVKWNMKKYMYFLHGEIIISENKVSIHFTFSALTICTPEPYHQWPAGSNWISMFSSQLIISRTQLTYAILLLWGFITSFKTEKN